MNYSSRRHSLYSFIPYVLALVVSIGIVLLSLETAIGNRTPSMRTAGLLVTILGVILVLSCLLVLWILATEAIAFEVGHDGSIFLQRLWLQPLTCVRQVRLLLKLGCVLRVDGSKGKCVPYVVVRADRRFVPMPADVYSRLANLVL